MGVAELPWGGGHNYGLAGRRRPRKDLAESRRVRRVAAGGARRRFDAADEAVLRADDYVSRDYGGEAGRTASLYGGTTRRRAPAPPTTGAKAAGSGDDREPSTVEVKPADGRAPFRANSFVIEHGPDRMLMLYWYQGRGRAVASEYVDKVYTVFDSIRLRRSDGAMVRVLVPFRGSEREAAETAAQFAAHVAPNLPAYVPD